MLQLYGYGIEINGIFDKITQQCTAAFQRHFRQAKVDGIADTSTVKTLHNLLKNRSAIV
jgi:N-acetylmuramoyl-L-alanine amidase